MSEQEKVPSIPEGMNKSRREEVEGKIAKLQQELQQRATAVESADPLCAKISGKIEAYKEVLGDSLKQGKTGEE